MNKNGSTYSNASIVSKLADGKNILSGVRGRPVKAETLMRMAINWKMKEKQAMYEGLFADIPHWCSVHQCDMKRSVEGQRIRWRCQKCHYEQHQKGRPRSPESKKSKKRRHKERMQTDVEYAERYRKMRYESQKRRFARNPDALLRYKAMVKNGAYTRRALESANQLTAEDLRLFNETYTYCLRCGSTSSLTVDHVLPLSKGGGSEFLNLQCLCRSCNSTKSAKVIDYRVQIPVVNGIPLQIGM